MINLNLTDLYSNISIEKLQVTIVIKQFSEKWKNRERKKRFLEFSWVFFQCPKMIESAHTLLHHLEDSSEDLIELDCYPYISQIVVSAHLKGMI